MPCERDFSAMFSESFQTSRDDSFVEFDTFTSQFSMHDLRHSGAGKSELKSVLSFFDKLNYLSSRVATFLH